MRVLVDTSIWSLALRRRVQCEAGEVAELRRLVGDRLVEIIGPIRQEILAGIRDSEHFKRLETHLEAFLDAPLLTEDYVNAAKFFNRCRSRGVQGSSTDFLLCAVAARCQFSIFTTDQDFSLFAMHLPITLHASSTTGKRQCKPESLGRKSAVKEKNR